MPEHDLPPYTKCPTCGVLHQIGAPCMTCRLRKTEAPCVTLPAGWRALPAGVDVDNLVLEHVFACEPYLTDVSKTLPGLSNDIDQAWLVVEKMAELGFTYSVKGPLGGPEPQHPGHHQCSFDRADGRPGRWGMAEADTVPLAICRAALATLEGAP